MSDAVIALVSRMGGRPAAFHIPLILSHRQPKSMFQTASRRKRSIESIWGEEVELTEIAGIPHALRAHFSARRSLPKVSILVPTRNGHDLLSVCMSGLSQLDYAGGVEVIVIDNESDDPATLAYLDRLEGEGVMVLRHPGAFNFSAMNNRAARAATGELLCLLNNDIEMHDRDWLKSMALHAMRPGVGAVGALLQYPDGTVQHAGVTVGTGEAAGHVYRGILIGESGHRNMHRLTRHVTAVTAACLVVRKELYFEAGGLDEIDLQVAFNDVDLCLKLSQLGYRNVFAGEALLTHHESKSRGSDFSSQNLSRYLGELAHLQKKWGTKQFIDPYGHPLVMRSSERFVLGP
jgi:GT2 family glycosyltransferase